MSDDKIRELLREMRDEPVPAGSLARVRQAVESRVEGRAGRGWWKLAAPVAAMAGIAIAVWFYKPASSPAVAVPVAQAVLPPAIAPVEQPAAETVDRPVSRRLNPEQPRVRKPRRSVPIRQVASKGAVIRIETPDPNVVIVLLGN
jgi:hypothetical protein